MITRDGTLDTYVLKEMPAYLKRITLTPEDIWLDAGGNIGAFANAIHNSVARVISFEPDAENFMLLEQNTQDLEKCFAYNMALVGNSDATRTFYLNKKKNKGAHSFLVKGGREAVTVNCCNFPATLPHYGITKIKMDVEGAEIELLESMTPEHWAPIQEFIMEYHFNVLGDKDHSKYFNVIEEIKKYFPHVSYNTDPKKNWTTLVHAKK